jgi:hypothetical protein
VDVHIGSARTVGKMLFILGIQVFIHNRLVPSGYEYSSYKKLKAFRWTHKHKIEIFTTEVVTVLIKFQ